MARTAADVALLLEAIAGPDGLDPRQKGRTFRAGLYPGFDRGRDGAPIGHRSGKGLIWMSLKRTWTRR